MQKKHNSAKNILRFLVGTVATQFLMGALASSALARTPDYWECTHRVGGEWNFGRAPQACNVNHKLDPGLVNREFAPVLFADTKDRVAERQRYMSEMYAFIRDAGTYYIKRRNPDVSQAEINGFVQGFFALAHQESFWSHYRNTGDGITRYMRGDFGHGHGMMQVDDRSHSVALEKGKGAALHENVIYGLDIFYSNWLKAVSSGCVSNSYDYKTRARAAWSAYNGGSSRICRWANPSDNYASHDQAYLSKLESSSWLRYVTDQRAPSSLNVPCLMEGNIACGTPGVPPVSSEPKPGVLYETSSGQLCLFKNSVFECLSEVRDLACLEAKEGRGFGAPEKISQTHQTELQKNYGFKTYDRAALCSSSINGLLSPGAYLQVHKNIYLRSSPAGQIVGLLESGSSHAVLGFEIRDWQKQDRYYRVRTENADGYFYAGAASDHLTWATSSQAGAPVPGLAQAGDSIRVVNVYGINIRRTPGGELLGEVPKGSVVDVSDLVIQGSLASVYYLVSYNGVTGFIYSGDFEPQITVTNWTHIVRRKNQNLSLLQLQVGISYRYLRSCDSTSCAVTETYVRGVGGPNEPGDVLVLLESKGDWVRVRHSATGSEGWLNANETTEYSQ